MPDDNPAHMKFRLVRRRESVTADEVIAKMREVPWPSEDAARFCEAAIQMVEISIIEICRPGGEEKPDGRE